MKYAKRGDGRPTTIATQEENRIYTNYEGWLPDEDERPTNVWSNNWTGLIRESYPNVTADPLPTTPSALIAPPPDFDPQAADLLARLATRGPQT